MESVTDEMLLAPKLTIAESAKIAGVSRDQIEKWIRNGELLNIKAGTTNRSMHRLPSDIQSALNGVEVAGGQHV